MAKKIVETANIQPEIKSPVPTGKVWVKALQSLACVGYAYFEGNELEVSHALAEEWINMGLVRKC